MHLQRASALFELQRYADAERELRSALVEHPDDALAHAMLGIALSHLDRLPEAQEAADQGIECNPAHPYAHYAQSLVLIRSGRSSDAMRAIREAIRLDPTNPEHLLVLAWLLFHKSHWPECLDALGRVLAADPQHVECLNLRGAVLRKLERWQEANQAFEAALAIDPENAESHHSRGALMLARGESDTAIHHLFEARRLDPITKNDSDAIAAALGQQLPSIRRWAPFLPRWHLWWTKATSALFMIVILMYLALTFEVPHDLSGSVPGMIFGMAVANLLLAPYSFDVLATAAALLLKRRTIGVPWYWPWLQLTALCLMHLLVTVLAILPELTMTVLTFGSFSSFGVGLYKRCLGVDSHDHRSGLIRRFAICLDRSCGRRRLTTVFYALYTAILVALSGVTSVFLMLPKYGFFVALGIFAVFSFFSDNVERSARG